MRSWLYFLWVGLSVLNVPDAGAIGNTQAQLLLSAKTAQPGQTILGGVKLVMAPGWHTYWRNPGDSGMATRIVWDLPPGFSAGEVMWPVPQKITEAGFTTYIYQGEIVLLVPLSISTNAAKVPALLKAKIDWLECEKQCVPGGAEVSASLVVGSDVSGSSAEDWVRIWQNRLPHRQANGAPPAWWEGAADKQERTLNLEWRMENLSTNVDFYPYANEAYEIQAPTSLSVSPAKVVLRKQVKRLGKAWPAEIKGILVINSPTPNSAPNGYEVTLVPSAPTTNASQSGPSLGLMLLYAFIGGLILNIMPCVLPVIALKILGFVSQSQADRRVIRTLGLIYGLGILASFLILALLVIGVQETGRRASWGMQFGNPLFLVILTTLVTLVALNLFGIFEVTLSGGVMGAAGELTRKKGKLGAFFNGILATALATPCTAPFLSVALGYAFLQSPAMLVLFFLMIGLGLSAPYVILSFQPIWLKFLPKPGAWMEKFKVAMGFPMLATAIWLLFLTQVHYGKRVWWLGIFLVIIALAAWIFGEFYQRGHTRKGLALGAAVLLLAGGYGYALEGQLHWRFPLKTSAAGESLITEIDGIPWQRWSSNAVVQARAVGRPVFVDFTADWCVTCQANKRFSIEIPSVRKKLQEINAVALLGDDTTLPDNITAELSRFHRAGVPLVLVYPRQADLPPLVLPEILTPQTVLQALDEAGK